MLRAVVGLFVLLVLGTVLSNGVSADVHHDVGCDQAQPSVLAHALALESELETGLDDLADPPFSDAIPEISAISRLVTGRRDRRSTHLEALLTCGRLLI